MATVSAYDFDRGERPRGLRNWTTAQPEWARASDDELLDLRFCDLGVQIPGTRLVSRIDRLHAELERRGLRFRPHYWLSNEWFSPDGVPGIAIPFYLAHPRLMQLEFRQMLQVEGGTDEWCMQLLRHEAGHAIEAGYRLHRRKRWQQIFGKSSQPYPKYYKPKPYSKHYVLHLDWWYAQSHPDEDFAETFAVWLKPGSHWRKHYQGWPVIRKLQYVDELMREIGDTKPPVSTREKVEPLSRIRKTLRKHYSERRRHYQSDSPEIFSHDLQRLFPNGKSLNNRRSAAAFLRRHRTELRRVVARATGEHPYAIDQILSEMIISCRQLSLYVDRPDSEAKLEVATLLGAQVVNYIHSGQHRVPL